MFSVNGILGKDFAIMSAGLQGLSMRQQANAENAANIDTPGFQARRVDFEGTLRSAMTSSAQGSNSIALSADGAKMPSPLADGITSGELASKFSMSRSAEAPTKEDITNSMVETNIRYRVLTQQITNRLNGLRTVLNEIGKA